MVHLPSFDISGQVVLVTGASSGIGRHFAEVLAAAGAKVAAVARRKERLEELAREIESRGGKCLPLAGDVTKQDSIRQTIAAAVTQLGPVSILVNNAGVVVSKPLFEHTEEDWDYVVDTNLKGAWLAAREFAHHLVEAKRPGRIVNISSIEIEEVLYRHPQVMEAAVVARPDEKWGETPCAFITLKPEAGPVSPADIIAFCRANLAHYKLPKAVVFGPLPKTSTGKIQKYALREQAKEVQS